MGTDAFGRSSDERDAGAGARPVDGPSAAPDRTVTVGPWLIVLLLGAISLGGSALFLVRAERENRDDPVQQAQRGEITDRSARSLLRADPLRAAYAAALRRVREGELVTGLTVTPVGLTLQVRDGRAFLRRLEVDVVGGVEARDAGRSEADGLLPSRVDLRGVPAAVARVRARIPEAAARVTGVDLGLTVTDGRVAQSEWRLAVADVRPRDETWFARRDGRVVRRSDEDAALTRPELRPPPAATPSPAATPAARPGRSSAGSVTVFSNGRRVRLTGARARRLQVCIEEARARGTGDAVGRCLEAAGL